MKKCPKCGKLTDSKFCPECGEPLAEVEEIKVCPNCGAEAKSKFCPECGAQMVDSADQIQNSAKESSASVISGDVKLDDIAVDSKGTAIPAAPKAKGPKSKKMIIIGAAIVLVLALILGLGGNSSNDTSTSDTSSESTETVEEPAETEEVEEEPEETVDSSSLFGEFTKEEDYESMSYDDLARNPDEYEGKKFKGSGNVLQVLESDTEVDMRVATSSDGWDDVVYVVYSPDIVDSRILEDDHVTFYGESHGLYSYESTMGGTITLPIIYVQKISVD